MDVELGRGFTPAEAEAEDAAAWAPAAAVPCAPVQALTASCSDEERARCAAAGTVDLMPKPITKLDMLDAAGAEHCTSMKKKE
jgi:CheY-like chemotaxis protein